MSNNLEQKIDEILIRGVAEVIDKADLKSVFKVGKFAFAKIKF